MKIIISPMSKSDFGVLKKLVYQAYGQELGEPWTIETSLEHCNGAFVKGYAYTARKGKIIVGGIFTNPAVYEKGAEIIHLVPYPRI